MDLGQIQNVFGSIWRAIWSPKTRVKTEVFEAVTSSFGTHMTPSDVHDLEAKMRAKILELVAQKKAGTLNAVDLRAQMQSYIQGIVAEKERLGGQTSSVDNTSKI